MPTATTTPETTPTTPAGGPLAALRTLLPAGPGHPLAALRTLLGRAPGWRAPHRWADAGGLYATDREAWLYHQLPATLLRPDAEGRTGLDDLLRQLSAQRPGRAVHLLMHAWEEQAQAPAGTPAELVEYLSGALTFFVPTRALVLGVALDKSEAALAAENKALHAARTSLDKALGEYVPDFGAWETDRAAVEAVLAGFGATPPGRDAAAHLESWYTLGSSTDVLADERDDVIQLDRANVVELCAVAAVATDTPAAGAALPSSGRRGATVASVRGTLTGPDRAARADHSGTLARASVILGRRSESARTPWAVTLRQLPGVEQRPLPMRQLDGLDETLPCSGKRLSPVLNRVGAAHLHRVGFTDTVRVGDDVGAFVGLASPQFTYPAYLNPAAAAAPLTLVTGAAAAGKTFLAEHLATQCAKAGQRVLYLAATPGSGRGLADLAGATTLELGPGLLDPFRWLPAPLAAPLAEAAVAALVPDLTPEERRDLAAGFRRAAAVGEGSFDRVFAFADGVTAVAKVRRAQQRSAQVAALVSGADAGPVALAPATLLDLCALLPDGELPADPAARTLVDLAVALGVEHARQSPAPAGTLLVLDGAGAVLDGPLTAAALARLSAPAPVHVLLTTRETTVAAGSGLRPRVGRVLALAEDAPAAARAALALAGLDPDPAKVTWLGQARPVLADDTVHRPALVLYRDGSGRSASTLVGPVPPAALPVLTRGAARRYTAG